MVIASTGCHFRKVEASDRKYNAWLVDMFKQEAQSHQNAVLVCVYESHLQRRPLPHHHRADYKATIVRSYRGDRKVGEKIAYYYDLESVPQDWPPVTPVVGYLEYLFFDNTNEPIGIDVGEGWDYKPEFERVLIDSTARSGHERILRY